MKINTVPTYIVKKKELHYYLKKFTGLLAQLSKEIVVILPVNQVFYSVLRIRIVNREQIWVIEAGLMYPSNFECTVS